MLPVTTTTRPMSVLKSVPLDAEPLPAGAFAETRELERLASRLQERFPAVAESEIRSVITDSMHLFDDASVRKFVPLLVERIAIETLRRRSVIELRDAAG